jgi:phospholipase C
VTSEVSDHASIIQFLEAWTKALGTPAVCGNISAWRRQVCGDLTRAFDFSSPVYGLPDLPSTTATEMPANGSYHPPPASNSMPLQDAGTRPARPLPYQPNCNLGAMVLRSDATLRAQLSFSNSGPHVARACHFAVYNNAGSTTPRQYTVGPSQSGRAHVTNAAVNLGPLPDSGGYDLTVLGPNRFLRRFVGNLSHGDTTSSVQVAITSGDKPVLAFTLRNAGAAPVIFTIRQAYYSTGTDKIRVLPGHQGRYVLNTMGPSNGWYDVTVTVSGDSSWSRRYVGHLETGRPSVTGS